MKAFYRKALLVDLTKRRWTDRSLDDHLLEQSLGGRGLAVNLLLDQCPGGVDALAPENPTIFAIGPATDARVHGSSRYGVFTKSPLTGLWSESYAGGDTADWISRTGYDAVIIKGKSNKPVLIDVTDEGVVFHDAKHLWGLDTIEAEKRIRNKFQGGIVVIGPAGERLVSFSTINNNFWRQAGRTGVGATLGAKNVKGVVFRGKKKRKIHDSDGLKQFWREMIKRGSQSKGVANLREWGTPNFVAIMNNIGGFPSRYWRCGRLDGWENITAEALKRICLVKEKGCPRCFIACGKFTSVVDGPYKGLEIEGPEYETIWAFGGLCLIKDIRAIVYINDICDRLGLDTITSGNLVALTVEAKRLGRIEVDVDYGDVERISDLLRMVAYREGIGDILAKGIKEASKQFGVTDLAIHVKGMEPVGYDPRVLKGMGLAYATSPRGACHLRTTFYSPELGGISDPDRMDGKAELLVDYEDRLSIMDSLIICRFFRDLLPWDELNRLIHYLGGIELEKDGLRGIAARTINKIRDFNIRQGLKKEDDVLPDRFFRESLPETGKIFRYEDFERLLSDYYRLRGWVG